MGCAACSSSKHKTDKEKPQKNILPDEKSPDLSKKISDVNNFNINTTDFVAEKMGKITKDYNLLNPPIGKGAFGEVRKALHKKSGIMRAIKIVSKSNTSEEDQNKLINEVNMLKELDHPNIIKIFEFYQDENFFYIVTELCTGGELFDKIIEEKCFTEKKACETFRQILSAVFYCHSHRIVHRDLKPENLLYEGKKEDSMIKVIDFGTSREFDPSTKMNQKYGTPYYIAPEVLKKKYDEKCDIWSCGVILYIILCGAPPFNGKNDKIIMENVAKGTFNFEGEEWKQTSPEAKSFIRKMLEYDPVKRYNAEQALNDPWMKMFKEKNDVELPVLQNVLNNMKNFRANKKLQDATWMFLVNYLSTKEEKNELLKTFKSLDLNGDGMLSKEELIQGYSKMMSRTLAMDEVDRIMKIVDKNNSGSIDYTEFVYATINKENLLSKQRLETAFKIFDKDGNGTLSLDEIKEIFRGKDIDDNVWKEVIKEVDDNGDGQISLAEFKHMMSKLMENDQK